MEDDTSELFYERYKPVENILFSVVWKIIKDKDAAKDIMQDVAIIGILKFERLRKKESFNAWISSIATFEAYSYCRKRSRRSRFENIIDPKDLVWLLQTGSQSNVESNVAVNETNASIRDAIQQLALIDQQDYLYALLFGYEIL